MSPFSLGTYLNHRHDHVPAPTGPVGVPYSRTSGDDEPPRKRLCDDDDDDKDDKETGHYVSRPNKRCPGCRALMGDNQLLSERIGELNDKLRRVTWELELAKGKRGGRGDGSEDDEEAAKDDSSEDAESSEEEAGEGEEEVKEEGEASDYVVAERAAEGESTQKMTSFS